MTSTTTPASESARITAGTRPVLRAKRDDTRKPMRSRFISRLPRAGAATRDAPSRVARGRRQLLGQVDGGDAPAGVFPVENGDGGFLAYAAQAYVPAVEVTVHQRRWHAVTHVFHQVPARGQIVEPG